MPAHYVELKSGMGGSGQTQWQLAREQAGNDFGDIEANEWPYFEQQTGITPSAVTRTPFELTISSSGYTFRVAPSSAVGGGKVLLTGQWSKPLTFTQGVVQFAHHSYNPEKCDVIAVKCAADTWHWSRLLDQQRRSLYAAAPDGSAGRDEFWRRRYLRRSGSRWQLLEVRRDWLCAS